MAKPDPRVTKRRVTMRRTIYAGVDEEKRPVYHEHTAVDYVRPDFLDAYVDDARKRWDTVEVSEEPDAGPGGYDGATYVPHGLDHPLAGQTFPAAGEEA